MNTKKKRPPPPPRRELPQHLTGSAEQAAAAGDDYVVVIADASGNFAARADGRADPADCWAIYNKHTGIVDRRPGMVESAVRDECARLNASLRVEPRSQGIGRKPPRPLSKSAHASMQLTAVQWVELLWKRPETAPVLQHARDSGRKLSLANVRELMTFHERLLRNPDTPFDDIEWLCLPTATVELPSLPSPPVLDRPLVTERDEKRWKATLAAHEAECRRIRRARSVKMAAAMKVEDALIEAVSRRLYWYFGISRADSRRRNKARTAKKHSRKRG